MNPGGQVRMSETLPSGVVWTCEGNVQEWFCEEHMNAGVKEMVSGK